MEEKPSALVPESVRVLVPKAGYQWVSVDEPDPVGNGISVEQRAALARFEASASKRRQRGEIPRWWQPAAKRQAQEPLPDLHLRPVLADWPQPPRATYPLRDRPTLYREFAALGAGEPDPAALLQFANQHGQLGVGTAEGEPITAWLQAIHGVADALALIDATSTPATLAKWITWGGDSAFLAMRSGMRRLDRVVDARGQLEAGYHLARGDSRRAAQLFIQQLVNAGLEAHAVARVLWNPGRKALELRVQPRTLLGTLWLQVAELAAGQVADRECAAPGCTAWFQVAKREGARRPNRRTCSDSCRKRLERARAAAKAATSRRTASRRRPPKGVK